MAMGIPSDREGPYVSKGPYASKEGRKEISKEASKLGTMLGMRDEAQPSALRRRGRLYVREGPAAKFGPRLLEGVTLHERPID